MKEIGENKKNDLKEIYQEYHLEHHKPETDKEKCHITITGAMMGPQVLNEFPRYCGKRRFLAKAEGEYIYLQVECNPGVKEFEKAWRKRHRVEVKCGFHYFTPYFESKIFIRDTDNSRAYIRMDATYGMDILLDDTLTFAIYAGEREEFQALYTIHFIELEDSELHLSCSKYGFFRDTDEHADEYVSFNAGDLSPIIFKGLCRNHWGERFEILKEQLEYEIVIYSEEGKVMYNTIDTLYPAIYEEYVDKDNLIFFTSVSDISEYPEGTYTCFLYFMGKVQLELNFGIGKEEKGHITNKLSAKEVKQLIKDSTSESMKELDALIGLNCVKQAIKSNLNYVKLMKARDRAGLPNGNRILNMVFTGAPGTGKTTVARLLGSLLKEIGILSKGHLVEANRESMLGQYIGETEKRTKELIERAKGGILFIDEAYALTTADDRDRDFGKHAIDTLMPYLSDPYSKLVVVIAGYEKEMNKLLKMNPGLASRFPLRFNFPDYTPAELMQIAQLYFDTYQYKITHDAQQALQCLFDDVVSIPNFGNGRYVKTLIENSIIPCMADRIASAGTFNETDALCLIEETDIPKENAIKQEEVKSRKSIGFNVSR